MARRLGLMLIAALLALALGCATKEDTGTAVGGVAGAVLGETLGDSTATTLIGAVAGGLLGREIGRRLDDRDRTRIAETLEDQPTGTEQAWTNPDTGEQISVTPTDTFERDGRPCREFQMEVEGEDDPVTGTACRTASGDWEIVG